MVQRQALTEDEVYRRLLARVKAILADPPDDQIYVRAVPGIAGVLNSPVVQIVPGAGSVDQDHGTRVVQTFQVFVFERIQLDQVPEDTIRWQDNTFGILDIRSNIRGDAADDADAATGLIGHILQDTQATPEDVIVEPLKLLSFAQPTTSPLAPSWIQVSDTYQMIWTID